MDKLWTDSTARESVLARRRQLHAQARNRRNAAGAEADRYQTPQWLERSFVLPLSEAPATVVPRQSQPHHDDFSATPLAEGPSVDGEVDQAVPAYARPPSQEIDFARMIKRSDHCRTAGRAAIVAIGFAGLGVIAFLALLDPVALVVAIVSAALAAIAVGVRVRLLTAPVALLEP